jgi:hypothetical protein
LRLDGRLGGGDEEEERKGRREVHLAVVVVAEVVSHPLLVRRLDHPSLLQLQRLRVP